MDRLRKIIVIYSLLFTTLNLEGQEFIAGLGVNLGLGKRWEIEAEVQSRSYKDEINTHSWVIEGGVGFEISKNFSLSASYRNTSTKTLNHFSESDIENIDKNRYTANVSYKSKRYDNNLRISNRLRYQYSEHDEGKSKEYIRNKLGIDYKLSKNAKPYLAVEPYYYLNKDRFKYMRLYMGNKFSFNRIGIDLFLIGETRLDKSVRTIHYMLGLKVGFELRKRNRLATSIKKHSTGTHI